MSKHNFKIKLLLILILSIFSISNVQALSVDPYINETNNYQVIIEDDANLLKFDEIKKLKEEMKSLTKYGNVAFKTTYESSYDTAYYASVYYQDKFSDRSGVVFIIDMRNRYIYIYSDGQVHNIITNDKAELITDNIYKYAQAGDYYKCASVAFEQMNTLLSGGKITEPMRYISNALLAITLAFFTSFIMVLVSASIKKANTKEVIANCNSEMNVTDVTAKKIGTHRRYSPQSSSSGGHSGGFSGGGGHSGGGGGHRF